MQKLHFFVILQHFSLFSTHQEIRIIISKFLMYDEILFKLMMLSPAKLAGRLLFVYFLPARFFKKLIFGL